MLGVLLIMTKFKILSLFEGVPSVLGPSKTLTAIKKNKIEEVFVSKSQFGTDEVTNHKNHGGQYRVIHQYNFEHYKYWKNFFPLNPEEFCNGSYGENMTTEGVSEENICIGDVFQINDLIIQITEPRSPCATLNLRYENEFYLKSLFKTSKWGWFYKVLQAGNIKTNDQGILVERKNPELLLSKAIFVMSKEVIDLSFSKKLAECEDLSPRWIEKAKLLLK